MPSPSTDRIRAVYDDLAPSWNEREARGERLLIGEEMRQAVADALRGEVLELGSGTGATFPYLNWSQITSFTATDLSERMLDEARQRSDIAGRPVSFQQLEASALPYPNASFDTVTASLMLCTVPDPERTLREMSRVCRPDGHIVLLEHVRPPNPLLGKLAEWFTPMQARRMGCHFDRQTDRLVQEMGFVIERHERRFFSVFRLLVLQPLPGSTG